MTLSVEPTGVEAFSAVNSTVGQLISAAGAVDAAASLGAAAAALGPIGAVFLAAYAPAQANNLSSTLLVGAAHEGIAATVKAAGASFIATDSG